MKWTRWLWIHCDRFCRSLFYGHNFSCYTPCNSVKINDLWWFGIKHTVCPYTGLTGLSVCMCALQDHECIDISSTVTPPEHSHDSYRSHFCCWKTHKTVQPNTHGLHHSLTPSTRSGKKCSFMANSSFSNKSKGNSGLCCGLTRRNSQTPQMRLHLRAKEREHYYYDCKSEWMNGASSCPHITLLVVCLAWVWVATVLYIQGDVFHQTVATYVQICIVLFVLCLL